MTAPRFASHSVGRFLPLAAVAALVPMVVAGGARSSAQVVRLIAFTRPDGIYVMHADGTDVRLLRHTGWTPWVTWSPDGRKLAYVSFSYRKHVVKGGMWVMNADGTSPTLVAKTSFEPSRPTWSPDGRRIAFAQPPGGHRLIWIVNADGTNLHQSAVPRLPPIGAAAVDWSPSGDRFAVALGSWGPPGSGIYTTNTNGGDLQSLTLFDRQHASGEPDWSPDGRRIVFTDAVPRKVGSVVTLEARDQEIWIMDAGGGSRVRLTHNGVPDYEPAWSPDGRTIAFVGAYTGTGSAEIYAINADGTGFTRLTHNRVSEASPSWQP